jgi:iron(III) transport system permease protein
MAREMARLGRPPIWSLAGRRLARHPGTPAAWVVTVLVGVFVLLPILTVFRGAFDVSALGEPTEWGLSNWSDAWTDPRITEALWNTFAITAIRLGIGLLVALPVAWLLVRTDLPGARLLEFAFWVSFFLPVLAVIQGWTFLLEGQVGWVNQQLDSWFGVTSPIDIRSFWGIIWVHLMSGSITGPVILFAVAFRNVDGSMEEAARVSGSSMAGTFRKVTFPLIRPFFSLLAILALIRGLQSFEIERLLGSPAGIDVYGTLVVNLINFEPPRTGEALALSSLILLVLVPLLIAQRLWVGDKDYGTVTGKIRRGKLSLGRWRRPAFVAVSLLVVLLTVVPFLALLAGSFMTRWGFFDIPEPWTTDHWTTVFGDEVFVGALTNTLQVGLLASVVAMVAFMAIAYVIVRFRFFGKPALELTTWLPWTVPGVLLSLALLTVILEIPMLRFLHNSLAALVIALLLLGLPLGVHLLRGGLEQLGPELEEASAVSGARWWTTQWRVIRPLMTPMLLTVGLITFIAAVNEVSAVVLLADVQTETLSLLSLRYLASMSSQRGAASVVILVITFMSVGIALVARALGLRLDVEAAPVAGDDRNEEDKP